MIRSEDMHRLRRHYDDEGTGAAPINGRTPVSISRPVHNESRPLENRSLANPAQIVQPAPKPELLNATAAEAKPLFSAEDMDSATDGVTQSDGNLTESQSNRQERVSLSQAKPKRLKAHHIAGISLACLVIAGGTIGLLLDHGTSSADPVPNKVLSSVDFPVYYPTNMPQGYKIDTKSFKLPQDGVIVYDLANSHNNKIYISEEARPSSFDFGAYYNKFSDKKTTILNTGTVVVGRINNGQTEVASLATNNTWILANTGARPDLGALSQMLSDLSVSH